MLLRLYRLIKFLVTNVQVDTEGHFTIQGPNYTISSSQEGLLINTDGKYRLNCQYYLENCDEDFDPETYSYEPPLSINLPKLASCCGQSQSDKVRGNAESRDLRGLVEAL